MVYIWQRTPGHCLGCATFPPLPLQTALCYCYRPQTSPGSIPIDNDRTGRRARWALELDPFEWTVIYKEGHLNADAMSRRTADIRPTEQSTFSSGPGNPPSDKRHSFPSPVSLSSPISSVHHSLCSTDTKPVCCYLTGPQPPPASSRCVTQSVFSTFVLQLPEDDFKKEQQQDSILSEVISWKVKGQKQSRWTIK